MTLRINLLPHRELKRAARQRQFNLLAAAAAALGLLIIFTVHSAISGLLENQSRRNRFLEQEITKLDREIAEIQKLKEQTQSLLARKQVVETLQSDRAEVVHVLDQLVRQLPDGVYLKAIKQTGSSINLQGYAQSNARVSTLMRNLEASGWLESPELVEIKTATVNGLRANEFSLNVKLTSPQKKAESAARKSAPGQDGGRKKS